MKLSLNTPVWHVRFTNRTHYDRNSSFGHALLLFWAELMPSYSVMLPGLCLDAVVGIVAFIHLAVSAPSLLARILLSMQLVMRARLGCGRGRASSRWCSAHVRLAVGLSPSVASSSCMHSSY